jgi:hypothetical protein
MFTYLPDGIFVSKACGFKAVFFQLNVEVLPDADNWIDRVEVIENQIITDTITHVEIYH